MVCRLTFFLIPVSDDNRICGSEEYNSPDVSGME